VTARKKAVDVDKYYNPERLRPKYESFIRQPLFLMPSDV
jgi:6-phosphofructokinase 1